MLNNHVQKVHLLTSERTITAATQTKSCLRDDSGILYTNSAGVTCHRRLEKILLIESTEQVFSYTIVSEYSPTDKGLCKDSITIARLNEHIIVLNIPRLESKLQLLYFNITHDFVKYRKEDKVIVPLSCIIDKCVIMDLRMQMGYVFASYYPNCKEPE